MKLGASPYLVPGCVPVSGPPYLVPDSAGGLRLWAVDDEDIATYIEPDGEYTVQELIGMTLPNSETGVVRRFYVEGVSASSSMADQQITVTLNSSGPSDTLKVTVAGVNLTAHRTGLNFGQTVTEQTENIGNPADFVVLVNDDEEEDELGLRRDDEDDMAAISGDGDPDDDLVKITLGRLPGWLDRGLVQVILVGGAPVRVFDSDGQDITRLFSIPLIPEDSPCLAMDLSALQGPLAGLTSGDVDLWFEGLGSNSGVTLLYQVQEIQGQTVIADDEVEIAIKAQPTIKSITYEPSYVQKDGKSVRETGTLDDKNPNGQNGEPAFKGGWRLFAEAPTLADRTTPGWNRVVVVAEVENAEPGDIVYFRSFDVDDPSEDPTVDGDGRNHDPAGNDNVGLPTGSRLETPAIRGPTVSDASAYPGRLAHFGMYDFAPEGAVVAAVVGNDLRARVVLATSFNAGDNFRVAASFSENAVGGLQTSDSATRRTFVPTAETINEFDGLIGGQLSIWRSLHIEQDTMERYDRHTMNELGDTQCGVVGSVQRLPGGAAWVSLFPVGITKNAYENGTLRVVIGRQAGTNLLAYANYPIISNDTSRNLQTRFLILLEPNQPLPVKGSSADVYDDDFSATGNWAPRSKRTPLESTEGINDWIKTGMSIQNNRLAAAYVIPEYEELSNFGGDAWGTTHLPSTAALKDHFEQSPCVGSPADRGSKNLATLSFWTGYLCVGFQGPVAQDADPDIEDAALYGECSGDVSSVYVETMRDSLDFRELLGREQILRSFVAAHEITHQLLSPRPSKPLGDPGHVSGYNLMAATVPISRLYSGSTLPLLSPETIKNIRWHTSNNY